MDAQEGIKKGCGETQLQGSLCLLSIMVVNLSLTAHNKVLCVFYKHQEIFQMDVCLINKRKVLSSRDQLLLNIK